MTEENKQITEQTPAEKPVAAAPETPVAPATPAIPVATPVAAAHAAPAARPAMAQRGRGPGGGGQRGGGMFRGRGGQGGGGPRRGGPPRKGGPGSDVPTESDYEEKNLEVARVTRVTKGGKRMRFRVLTVIGNRKGRVGFGLAKGLDVAGATAKATAQARKALITLSLHNETIPHAVDAKFAAARVLLKPAPKGTGIKAGGAVRVVLELAGVPNVVSKILGSANKINNVKATFIALKKLRLPAAKTEGQDEGAKPVNA